jgi:chemotaxis protein histidine kinase CheA
MIVSKPCIHPECPEREGFIRGQYQSVEFIREIPVTKPPHKSQSTADLMDGSHSPGRPRGKTISYSQSRGSDAKGEHIDVPEDDEAESNPVEWIMLTRSDPGGSVPRFMVERGTPGSIVADASKFLDWACSTTPEELDNNTEHFEHKEVEKVPDSQPRPTHTTKVLHDYETNGHLSGIGNARAPPRQDIPSRPEEQTHETPPTDDGGAGGGILGMVTGVVGAAGGFVAAHAPAVIANHLPGYEPAADEVYERPAPTMRRFSTSTIDSASSVGSFVSADEGKREPSPRESLGDVSINSTSSFIRDRPDSEQAKELRKLEERKRKLDEKLAKTRERELSKKSELTEKEAEEIAKAEEKHKKEVAKQEEKYRRELAKLEAKREKEERKAAEKRKKAQDKDEKARLTRELAEMKAERDILRVERDLLRKSMGELQAENTALAARLGKLGPTGEQVLKEVKDDVSSGGRLRASSLSRMIGGGRPSSLRSVDGAVATSVKESHAPPPL